MITEAAQLTLSKIHGINLLGIIAVLLRNTPIIYNEIANGMI